MPEVQKLVDEGRLHAYDAEWIGNLQPEGQLAAAEKCMSSSPVMDSDAWRQRFKIGAGKRFKNQDKRADGERKERE